MRQQNIGYFGRIGIPAFVPILLNSKMFFIYIIKSLKNGRYYIGSCDNVEKRLERHNKGIVKSTKAFILRELLHTEKFESRSDSRNREQQLKSWKSREALERLIVKHF